MPHSPTFDLVLRHLSNPSDKLITCFTAIRTLVSQYTIIALLLVEGNHLVVIYDIISYSQLRLHSAHLVNAEMKLGLFGKQSSIELSLAGTRYRACFSASVKSFLEAICNETPKGSSDVSLSALGYSSRVDKEISKGITDTSTPSSSKNPFILSDKRFNTLEAENIKKWFQAKHLRDVRDEYSSYSNVKLFVGTWNVAGQAPDQDISSWFGGDTYNIYVFGLQEIDLSTQAYIVNDGSNELAWAAKLEEGLGPECVRVGSKQMIGMLLMVYARKADAEEISEFSSTSIGQGFIGLGNKGAVAVRFRYKDSYFTFCNSHLASDTGMTERRNQDYNQISKKTAFDVSYYKDSHDFWLSNPAVASFYDNAASLKGNGFSTEKVYIPFTDANNTKLLSLFDTDHLVWLGDLNYRLNLSNAETKKLIADNDFPSLLANDQLLTQRNAKTVFNGFQEQTITFLPTYKYDIGTCQYDTSEKKRIPAYCDRILWKINPLNFEAQDWIHPISYKSQDSITTSDHKPVMASFIAKVRTIDRKTFETARMEILQKVDQLQKAATPVLVPSKSQLDFGKVTCLDKKIIVFEFENTGEVQNFN